MPDWNGDPWPSPDVQWPASVPGMVGKASAPPASLAPTGAAIIGGQPVQSQPIPPDTIQNLKRLERLASARVIQLKPEQVEQLTQMGEPVCTWCGGFHSRACPRIRSMTFHPNGNPASVTFWRHDQVNWEGVAFDDGAPDEIDTPSPS